MSCVTNIGAAECVTNEILASTSWESEHHLDVCHATNGAYTEI